MTDARRAAVHKLVPANERQRNAIEVARRIIGWVRSRVEGLKIGAQFRNEPRNECPVRAHLHAKTGYAYPRPHPQSPARRKRELLALPPAASSRSQHRRLRNDIRACATKRKISGGTVSEKGRRARDFMLGLAKTCSKLRVPSSTTSAIACTCRHRVSETSQLSSLPTQHNCSPGTLLRLPICAIKTLNDRLWAGSDLMNRSISDIRHRLRVLVGSIMGRRGEYGVQLPFRRPQTSKPLWSEIARLGQGGVIARRRLCEAPARPGSSGPEGSRMKRRMRARRPRTRTARLSMLLEARRARPQRPRQGGVVTSGGHGPGADRCAACPLGWSQGSRSHSSIKAWIKSARRL